MQMDVMLNMFCLSKSVSKVQYGNMFPLNESWVIKAKLDRVGQTLDGN